MCLWSIRDAAFLLLPLKSLTVLDVGSALGLLGMLARHAASRTQLGHLPHSPTRPHMPLSLSTVSPLFMRACYCWTAFRNEKTQEGRRCEGIQR